MSHTGFREVKVKSVSILRHLSSHVTVSVLLVKPTKSGQHEQSPIHETKARLESLTKEINIRQNAATS